MKWKHWLRRFGYALNGWRYAVRTERNVQIHLIVTGVVLAFSIGLPVTQTEFFIVLTMIALVLSLEMVNTAVEHVVDSLTVDHYEWAKRAKDVAAGAVLLAAVVSFVIGLMIFLPYLFS